MSKQNKVIMSGLALYHDADPEPCGACNFDMSWLFNYPSTLLWADKIIVTPTILKVGQKGGAHGKEEYAEVVSDVVRTFFDIVGSYGLFEVKDPSATLTKEVVDTIGEQAETDRELLAETFPEQVDLNIKEKLPGGFRLGEATYCIPRVITTYLAVALSGAWDAHVILTPDDHNLLNHVFGLRARKLQLAQNELNAFTEVIRGYLPEIDVRPHAACWNCQDGETCDKHNLKIIEKDLQEYLRWREYDEVIQMKALFGQLSQQLQSETQLDLTNELVQSFRAEERKITAQLRRTFPKVSRWSSLATIASVPIIVAGVAGGAPLVAGLGAAVAGVAQIAKHYVDYLTSKHRWVFFRQSSKKGSGEEEEPKQTSRGNVQ